MEGSKAAPAGVDADVWAQLPANIREEYLTEASELKRTTSTSTSTSTSGATATTKRRKVDIVAGSAWTLSNTDGLAAQTQDGKEVETEEGNLFLDEDFPPQLSSLSGSRKDPKASKGDKKVVCKCGIVARQRTVSKGNANQNRRFWGCSKYPNGCNFFQWAKQEEWEHGRSFTKFFWKRPLAHFGQPKIIRDARPHFRGSDIMQGKVGDCWFIAALFVIAEREDLMSRLVETRSYRTCGGPYVFWLFIDCEWRKVVVDDSLPHYEDKKGNDVLAFCKARDHCLWLPLLEKAYAKAHGSYRAISGGWIDEAMFDLTSFPTQTIYLSGFGFDKDTTWQKLLSYSESKFPMGCSCMNPGKGSGLVGHHAYSIIEVRDCVDAILGAQRKLDAYFKPKDNANADAEPDVTLMTEEQQFEHAMRLSLGAPTDAKPGQPQPVSTKRADRKTLRMLRIRNPWGKGEWKGAFSGNSEKWTAKLRKALKNVTSSNDGTFWIEYDDFLAHYAHGTIDVCMAHPNWHSSNVNLSVPKRSWTAESFVEIKALVNTWTYISIAQPTKRGKADGQYYYSALSFLLVRVSQGHETLVKTIKLAGKCKVYHTDVILDQCKDNESYLLIPFIATSTAEKDRRSHDAAFTIRLFSAEPLQTRQVQADPRFALTSIHSVVRSSPTFHSGEGFSTRRIYLGNKTTYLKVAESRMCCMVIAANGSNSTYLNCSFLLHGPGIGASNAIQTKRSKAKVGSAEYPTYVIPPSTERVIEVVSANLHTDDEEYSGNQSVLFVLSHVLHFHTNTAKNYRNEVGTVREAVSFEAEVVSSSSSSSSTVDVVDLT